MIFQILFCAQKKGLKISGLQGEIIDIDTKLNTKKVV
jgi:hypothetical protein